MSQQEDGVRKELNGMEGAGDRTNDRANGRTDREETGDRSGDNDDVEIREDDEDRTGDRPGDNNDADEDEEEQEAALPKAAMTPNQPSAKEVEEH